MGRAQRERDAELDKLTVQARLAAVTARELTVPTLTEIFRQLIDRALHGSGHVTNAAAKLVFELASAVNEDKAEEVEGVAWEEMTPGQRAAARAVIDREIVRLAQLEEAPRIAPSMRRVRRQRGSCPTSIPQAPSTTRDSGGPR